MENTKKNVFMKEFDIYEKLFMLSIKYRSQRGIRIVAWLNIKKSGEWCKIWLHLPQTK